MSTLLRKVIYCLIGLLAGMAAWSVSELILTRQSVFPSYLVFSIVIGGAFGLTMGGFFGSSEGITLSIQPKILTGIATGMIVGVFGGTFGFLFGQGLLFLIGEMILYSNKMIHTIGVPVSRAMGWGIVGVFVGAGEGFRSLSWTKIKVGIAGGLIGGIIGGLTLEFIQIYFPHSFLSRFIGLMVLGSLIGLFYGFVETGFSQGVLKVLNGTLKGKEYLILKRKIRIGSASKADIQLVGYADVASVHALIFRKGKEIFVKQDSETAEILVNDTRVIQRQLEFEDVLQVGSVKFLFYYQ